MYSGPLSHLSFCGFPLHSIICWSDLMILSDGREKSNWTSPNLLGIDLLTLAQFILIQNTFLLIQRGLPIVLFQISVSQL